MAARAFVPFRRATDEFVVGCEERDDVLVELLDIGSTRMRESSVSVSERDTRSESGTSNSDSELIEIVCRRSLSFWREEFEVEAFAFALPLPLAGRDFFNGISLTSLSDIFLRY